MDHPRTRDQERKAADAARGVLADLQADAAGRESRRRARLRDRLVRDVTVGAAVFGLPGFACLGLYGNVYGFGYVALSFLFGAAAGLWLNRVGGGAVRGFAIFGVACVADLAVLHAVVGNPLDKPGAAATLPLYLLFRLAAGLGVGRALGTIEALERVESVG